MSFGVSKTGFNKKRCSQRPRNSSRGSKLTQTIGTTIVVRPISKANRKRKESICKSKRNALTRVQLNSQKLT